MVTPYTRATFKRDHVSSKILVSDLSKWDGKREYGITKQNKNKSARTIQI